MNLLYKKVKYVFKDLQKGRLLKKIKFRQWQKSKKKRIENFLQNDFLDDKKRVEIRQTIFKFSYKPLISIILPVYNVDEIWLRLCIESVTNQLYENWEFCIADDFSQKKHIRKILEECQAKDSRFKVIFRTENGHISAASNSALELATGEFVALLDHDDELTEDALFEVIKQLNQTPNADFIYSDQDKINENGNRSEPIFKPIWNENLFYSMNFTNHLSVYRTEILRKIGGFRIGFEGSQDYDLALRFIEQTLPENIKHIPKILYHWRAISGSLALGSDEKSYAHERARIALREHFERKNVKVEIEKGFANYHCVIYDLPKNVSFEVISVEKFSSINSQKDVLVFIEKNVEAVDNTSFTELVRFAIQENIGAVGGKILNTDETIYHVGIVNGEFINQNFPSDFADNLSNGQIIRGVDAVCGVLAIRRNLFEKFREKANNFDELCQVLRTENYQIVFTPNAKFILNL